MNLVVKSLLIAVALLPGGAHAAERDGKTGEPGLQSGKDLHKVAAVQPAPSAVKKTRTAQGAKSKLAAEPRDAAKADAAAKEDRGGAAEEPTGASEQTVQLGGVRG